MRSPAMEASEEPDFDWAALAPLVHHVKIAIVEALLYMEMPLSPTVMVKLFEHKGYYLSLVSYHARKLESDGLIVQVDERPARGATEHFYAIPDRLLRR